MGNLSCGNLDPPPSSGGQSAASSPSALHEDGLTKRFRRCRSPFREPPKSDRHPVGMVIAIISERRSPSLGIRKMATGTGKTLTAAAIIKLFLRSGNTRRVLFLVDRLELEDQAKKAFAALLAADYQTVIFKENRDDWRRAEIVVRTVQSFLFNDKYQQLFSPTDFDLVISDEAHR